MIRLYDKPECPFCYRVRLALGFLGVDYERRPYDDPVFEGEWRAFTRAKTVPVMVDDALVITDSGVMLEYLHDVHGRLLPDGPNARARVRSLVQYADNPLGRASREVVFAKRGVPEADWDQRRIAAGTEQFLAALPALEAELAERDYFADGYTMADCAMTARLALSAAYGLEIPEELVSLRRWFSARLNEPAFVDASPPVVVRWLRWRSSQVAC